MHDTPPFELFNPPTKDLLDALAHLAFGAGDMTAHVKMAREALVGGADPSTGVGVFRYNALQLAIFAARRGRLHRESVEPLILALLDDSPAQYRQLLMDNLPGMGDLPSNRPLVEALRKYQLVPSENTMRVIRDLVEHGTDKDARQTIVQAGQLGWVPGDGAIVRDVIEATVLTLKPQALDALVAIFEQHDTPLPPCTGDQVSLVGLIQQQIGMRPKAHKRNQHLLDMAERLLHSGLIEEPGNDASGIMETPRAQAALVEGHARRIARHTQAAPGVRSRPRF